MTKLLLTMSFCLLSILLNAQKNNNILKFENVGESDKPIPSLFIYCNKIVSNESDFFIHNISVNSKVFLVIKQFIKANRQENLNEHSLQQAHPQFLVSINTEKYAWLKRKDAVSYFKKLQIKIKDHKNFSQRDIEEINKKLTEILSRIDW